MTIRPQGSASELTPGEMARYARHLSIPGIGVDGQRMLRQARVLVVGAGGLGSPTLLYLAAAGVGHIGVIDDDVVESSNLQRQVVHGSSGVGKLKVESARDRLADLNPLVDVQTYAYRLDPNNVLGLVSQYDVVVDGSDNFPTRFMINDACVLAGRPCVWGSVYQFSGQASVFWAERGPCYRCLYPQAPPPELAPSCVEGGVFGALCATVGSIQATEVIKLITGVGDSLVGQLWVYDGLTSHSDLLGVGKDPECSVCGANPTITRPRLEANVCSSAAAAVPLPTISAVALANRLLARRRGLDSFELWDVREPHEWEAARIPGARCVGPRGLASAIAEPTALDVLIYCQGGARSARALNTALAAGRRAAHLEGGITAWQRLVPADVQDDLSSTEESP